MDIAGYLEQVRHAYESGHATEHSYRPALHALFKSIDPAVTVINEPKKSEGGMPDFLFNRGEIPEAGLAAKDRYVAEAGDMSGKLLAIQLG